MVEMVNGFSYAIVLSIMLLVLYGILYFLLFLCEKVCNKKFLNNTLLILLYVFTSLPFLFCGLYVISLIFIISLETALKILMGLFGLFLIIYSIYRVFRKIKDIEYFGGV